jgi:2-polyprenyl-6-methoxyphenol hydroxylase-like FAD-dependent oxidoreductase
MSPVLEAEPAARNECHVRQARSKERNRAIVIGASMAGLAAARVLSDHYGEVILVERDPLEQMPGYGWCLHQGRHTDGIIASARTIWESLFPGLFEDLVEAGAVKADISRDAHWCFEGGEHARCESGLDALLVTRPLLEGMIRQRVRSLPNVGFRDCCHVKGLAAKFNDARRVVGIRVEGGTLFADMVVDASGRRSRSPQWLEALGYEAPKQEKIEVNVGCATRQFRRAGHHLNGALLASIAATTRCARSGIIQAQERDRWSVTLNSYGGQVPTELSAFIEFAKTLPAPYIYDVISDAEPIGEAQPSYFPANVRNHYESLHRFPKGYLVVGDAISCLNPAYGQSMSIAAMEAVELERALRANPSNFADTFFEQTAKIVDAAWGTAAGNDLRMPGVVGPNSTTSRLRSWYLAELHVSAQTDPAVAVAFQNVTNLLKPPQSLLELPLAMRVLSGAFCRRAAVNRSSRLDAAAKGAF